eukprot:764830-Hanusia_phi.AAC.2
MLILYLLLLPWAAEVPRASSTAASRRSSRLRTSSPCTEAAPASSRSSPASSQGSGLSHRCPALLAAICSQVQPSSLPAQPLTGREAGKATRPAPCAHPNGAAAARGTAGRQ